jgi:hypothetical protein
LGWYSEGGFTYYRHNSIYFSLLSRKQISLYRTFKTGLDIKYNLMASPPPLDVYFSTDFGHTTKHLTMPFKSLAFEQRFDRPFFTRRTSFIPARRTILQPNELMVPTPEPVIRLNEEITDYPGTVDLLNAVIRRTLKRTQGSKF